jgi:chromosome segregation ATPase
MSRPAVLSLIGLSVLVLLLASALASVGARLDESRISRDGLQEQVDDLQQDVASLNLERTRLAQQLEEQRQALERWEAAEAQRQREAAEQAKAAAHAEPVAHAEPAAQANVPPEVPQSAAEEP